MLLLAYTPLSMACRYTPNSYVETDLQVRQLTVEGMEQRLALLQSGADTGALSRDESTQAKVQAVFNSQGCTAAQHHNYAARNAKLIADWYAAHVEQQRRRDDIAQRFTFFSNQLSQAAR
ncbi:hypothetical protein D0B54_13020 [Solimonas sp. K1W22B-7]|nr:hypothetical protein D0B54_13020 [Solimonas sp. K1W22B-7]